MKTRPSKTKCFIWVFILSYTITRKKKIDFCYAEVIEGPEAPEGLLRVLFRFHSDRVFFSFVSDRVFFRFLSDRVLLRVLSGTKLFESSVIDFSSGSSIIYSSLGSSVLFFRHVAIYYQNVLLLFLLKADVLIYIIFSKRTSHVTICREKKEEILSSYKHEILCWKYIYYTYFQHNIYINQWFINQIFYKSMIYKILLNV